MKYTKKMKVGRANFTDVITCYDEVHNSAFSLEIGKTIGNDDERYEIVVILRSAMFITVKS